MKKKNRPSPPRVVPPQPVLQGNVLGSFVLEATSILNEVTAWRKFSEDITTYINAKGLREDFDAWIAARSTPKG